MESVLGVLAKVFLVDRKEDERGETISLLSLDTVVWKCCLAHGQPSCGLEEADQSSMAEWKSRKKLDFTDIIEQLIHPTRKLPHFIMGDNNISSEFNVR